MIHLTLTKFGGYTVDRNHDKKELCSVAKRTFNEVSKLGFNALLELQKKPGPKFGKWQISLLKAMLKPNKVYVLIFFN